MFYSLLRTAATWSVGGGGEKGNTEKGENKTNIELLLERWDRLFTGRLSGCVGGGDRGRRRDRENERAKTLVWIRDLDVGEGRNWERSGSGCHGHWGERRRQWTTTLGHPGPPWREPCRVAQGGGWIGGGGATARVGASVAWQSMELEPNSAPLDINWQTFPQEYEENILLCTA